MVVFHEDQTSLLLFGPGNGFEPLQVVFEPPGECGTAVQPLAGRAGWSGAARLGLCCLHGHRRYSTAGDGLGGKSWGVSSLCVCLGSGSLGSQEQTGTEGRIRLINDFCS